MNKYDYVIFDLDGTLLNTKSGIIKSLVGMTVRTGLRSILESDYNLFIGPPIERAVSEYYGLTDEAKINKAAAMFRNIYANYYLFEAELYDGVTYMFEKLKDNGVSLAIATYKRHDYALKVIEHFGLDKYCCPCLGAGAYGLSKKSEIIKACIMEMNANYSRTVYVGDTEYDRIGSQEAGIDFLGVTYGFGYTFSQLKGFVAKASEIPNKILGGE